MAPAFWAAGLGVALVAAVPAMADEAPKYGGILTYMIPADSPPSFDAQREETYATIHSAAPFYSVLIRINPNNPESTTDIVCDLCRLRGPPSVSLLPHIGGIKRMPTKNGPGDRPRRAIPWSQVRFALGSPLEGSGFEPTVPLRDSAIRAGGAQTDVGRQNGRFCTAGPAVRIRLSGESGANLNSAS